MCVCATIIPCTKYFEYMMKYGFQTIYTAFTALLTQCCAMDKSFSVTDMIYEVPERQCYNTREEINYFPQIPTALSLLVLLDNEGSRLQLFRTIIITIIARVATM